VLARGEMPARLKVLCGEQDPLPAEGGA
jgi:hypothetical protein